jgi:hypothetical protein
MMNRHRNLRAVMMEEPFNDERRLCYRRWRGGEVEVMLDVICFKGWRRLKKVEKQNK